MPRMKGGVVYALVDPRTLKVQYIGQTTRTIQIRIAAHLSPSSLLEECPKNLWLRELLKEGLEPIVIILEECSAGWELVDAENKWIETFRKQPAGITNRYTRHDARGEIIRKEFPPVKKLKTRVTEKHLSQEQKEKDTVKAYLAKHTA